MDITAGAKLQWSVKYNNDQIILSSAILLQLEDGDMTDENVFPILYGKKYLG